MIYYKIVLEDGLVKIKPIDYESLTQVEKDCYYIVKDIDENRFICDLKYAVLSNQN